jgi:hypothetical protein
MRELARGIAVVGIWACVAAVGYKEPLTVMALGIPAAIATGLVFGD